MKYNLLNNVYFVEGAKNSTICDGNSGKVYSLNKVATRLFKKHDQSFLEELAKLNIFQTSEKNKHEEIQEVTVNKPSFIWFEIATNSCNLKCKHCCIGQNSKSQKRVNSLTFENWKDAISQAYNLGIKRCQFIGGEPFLFHQEDKDLIDLVMYAKEVGFSDIEIFTNTQIISEKQIREISDLNVKIATSIYSRDEKIHDRITGEQGSLQRSLKAINKLISLDINVRVEVVLMSINEETIEETVEYLKSLGVKYRKPDPIRPVGKGIDSLLTPSLNSMKKYGFFMAPNFITTKEKFLSNKVSNACLSNRLAIIDTGDVIPCVFSREKVLGNIKSQTLEDIISDPVTEKIRSITKDQILVCQDCEYRYVCTDCRPLAATSYEVIDSFFKYPNPRCTYNPYTGEWGKGTWKYTEKGLTYNLLNE